jgi:AmmeMemoRadiSam system protein A
MTTPVLDAGAREALLRRARAAIAATVGAEHEAPPATSAAPAIYAGAFVTIRVRGELRGCIGYVEADRPLVDVVEQCASSAAASDPRFDALRPAEFEDIDVEISVLGAIELVHDLGDVEIGRHGLIAERGYRRGLLLPQVASEWQWGREEFASHTCQKAGLPRDAWRTGVTLYRFEALVFTDRP